jgi:isopenicillin N synthase-like dioxygenase
MALGLGLDRDWFRRTLTDDPLILFRIFHYPPSAAGAGDQWGVGEHTDYGLLTLLAQDAHGGLSVRGPDGWLDAEPVLGSFVCNIGDMLERLTGGLYRSTPHRVRNESGADRLSFPFFLDPSWDAAVDRLPIVERPTDDGAAERWDHASVHGFTGTYGDYVRAKVAKVFPDLAAETGA